MAARDRGELPAGLVQSLEAARAEHAAAVQQRWVQDLARLRRRVVADGSTVSATRA